MTWRQRRLCQCGRPLHHLLLRDIRHSLLDDTGGEALRGVQCDESQPSQGEQRPPDRYFGVGMRLFAAP